MKERNQSVLNKKEFIKQLRKTTKKAGQVFIVRIFSQVIGLIAGIIYARFLGADLYGVFQLAFTTISVLLLFTVFGMSSGLIRYIPIFRTDRNKEALRGVINFSLTFAFLLSSIAAILLFLEKDFISNTIFHEPRLSKVLPIFCFILIFYSVITVLGGVIQAEKEAPAFIFFRYVLDGLFSVLIFVGFYFFFRMKLLGISWAKFLSSIFILLITIRWVIKKFPFLLSKPLLPRINKKEFVLYSASLLFVSFTYFLMNQVNNLLIGVYSVSKEVGFYSVGNIVAGLVIFILTSFNIIFAPIVSELYHKKEYETLSKMYSAVTRLVWIFTLPIFIWIVIFSDGILSIFGPDFVAAKWVLIFLAIGQFVNAAVGPNGLILSMSGHQKWEMLNGVVVATLNIGLNILLIPRFGAVGSAIGGAIALVIVNIIRTIEVWGIMKMFPYNIKFIKPIFAGIVGTVALGFLKRVSGTGLVYTVVGGVIGGILILGTIFLLGLEEEDKMLLEALKNKIFNQFRTRG